MEFAFAYDCFQYYHNADIAEMRALQITNIAWYKQKPLPILKDIMPAGQSHIQSPLPNLCGIA